MKRIRVFACLVLTVALIHGGADQGSAQAASENDALKNEMQAGADAFMTAFRNRDVEAIAAMWTREGLFVNEQGERFFGRDTIKREYAKAFKDAPDDLEILVEVDAAHMVGPNTVVVEGRAAVMPQPAGENRVMSRFTAVHVQRDGKWMVAHLRDNRVEIPPQAGKLEDLSAFIGTWQASRDDLALEINCRWVDDNKFIERTHTATRGGQSVSSGRQIIGVDPATGMIGSWSFNSDGSRSRGVWIPHGQGWYVESVGFMADGTPTTATYTLTIKDDNTFVWKSDGRMMGAADLPDSAEITLSRK